MICFILKESLVGSPRKSEWRPMLDVSLYRGPAHSSVIIPMEAVTRSTFITPIPTEVLIKNCHAGFHPASLQIYCRSHEFSFTLTYRFSRLKMFFSAKRITVLLSKDMTKMPDDMPTIHEFSGFFTPGLQNITELFM